MQKEFRKKALQVIVISEDYKGIEAVDTYFTKHKIDYLDIFLDKKGKIYQGLMLNHLPVSYLIDFNGKVVARSIPGKVIGCWFSPSKFMIEGGQVEGGRVFGARVTFEFVKGQNDACFADIEESKCEGIWPEI